MPHIRPATAADLPVIQELAHTIWPVAYAAILSPAQLQYMLHRFYSLPALEAQQADGHRFFLLEDAGASGFASCGPLDEPGAWKLHKLYVLPDKQGTGLGRQLLDVVIGQVRAAGGTRLRLNVNRFNPALHFYERLGFRNVASEDILIGEGYYMNDFVLEKQVTEE